MYYDNFVINFNTKNEIKHKTPWLVSFPFRICSVAIICSVAELDLFEVIALFTFRLICDQISNNLQLCNGSKNINCYTK